MTVNSSVHRNLFHSLDQFRRGWQIDISPQNRLLCSGKRKKNISKCCMLNFVSADNLKHFHIFPRKQNLTFHAKCLQMSNVYWKNKHIINMLSAENTQSANRQFSVDDIFLIIFLFFILRKLDLTFHVHCLN